MDIVQTAQKRYGFKSETTGDLKYDDARKLVMLKEYAQQLGVTIEAHRDGINIQVLDSKTRRAIAKGIGV